MWADTGTLVSALNGISSGDTYYITALNSSKYYTVPNTTISGQTFTCAEGSLSGTTLTPATGAGEFVFTAVDNVDNAYYIYNTNLKKYLVATGSKTFGYVESSSSDYGYWTFTTVGTGDFAGFSGVFSVQHNSKTHYMRAYNNTVKCYDGASNSGIYLFKKDPSNKVITPSINGDTPFITSTEVSISCGTDGAAIQYSIDNGANWANYSAPFSLTSTTTVKAKATKSGMTDSDEATATFTKITPMSVVAAIAYIDLGENLTGQYVAGKISQIDSYASNKITYWISDDGTTTNQMEVYQGKGLNGANFTAITDLTVGDEVVVSGTLQKYGEIYEFSANSQLSIFTPKVKAPTFSPAAGAVAANTNVTISTTTDGATIYYTTDGSDPTTTSSVYSAPITIDAAKTIKAFAVKDGYPDSDIASAAYTIAVPCATPTFSPVAGEVEKGTTVTISTETDGASIYYTTDGATPTTSSTLYSSAITINSAMTLKAIAVKDGMANSAVAEAAYTVRDYATLPFSYDGGKSNLPSGMTGSGLGSDYSAPAPKLKFDGSGDALVLKINEAPYALAFDIKGNSFSGGTFSVQTSADGSTYGDLDTYTELGNTETKVYLLTSTVRYIKWIYTSKSSGNVGLGNIHLIAGPVPATIGATGWATFSSAFPLDFENATPAGLSAYMVTGASGTAITKSAAVDNVPANTGLLLNGAAGDYTIPVLASSSTDVSTNKMKACVTATTVNFDSNNGYNYVLAANGSGKAEFQKIEDGPNGTVNIPAGKAYLALTSAPAPALSLNLDDVTGINDVRSQMSDGKGEVFNLAGQRVAQPTKGLYIVNGKKVVIK